MIVPWLQSSLQSACHLGSVDSRISINIGFMMIHKHRSSDVEEDKFANLKWVERFLSHIVSIFLNFSILFRYVAFYLGVLIPYLSKKNYVRVIRFNYGKYFKMLKL